MNKKKRDVRGMGLVLIQVVLVQAMACLTSFAVSYEDESTITIKSSFVNPYTYSEDETNGAAPEAYERDATGQKVPVSTEHSGDARPASEPL